MTYKFFNIYFKKQMTSCLDDNILDQDYFTSMPFQKATIPLILDAASSAIWAMVL
jgi:hypothetical protein